MSNLVKHAEYELRILSGIGANGMHDAMSRHILEMVKMFDQGGYSCISTGYAMSVLTLLLRFEPIRPLTGDTSVHSSSSPGFFHNQRCSCVFKEVDGKAYDIEGKVFKEPDGRCYTNSESRVYIEFPYTPKQELRVLSGIGGTS